MSALTHLALWSLGLRAAETQTSHAERECLQRHATGKRRLVEIGVWHGVNTASLRRVMAPDGILFAVDPFPAGRLGLNWQWPIAKGEVKRVKNGRVCWLRTTGRDAARSPLARESGLMDFVFIDGDHSYDGLREDWEGWKPLTAPGGIIALHDSRSSATRSIDDAGSARFTREVVDRDPSVELVEVVDTLSVYRRR